MCSFGFGALNALCEAVQDLAFSGVDTLLFPRTLCYKFNSVSRMWRLYKTGTGLTTGFIGSHTVTHNYSVYTLQFTLFSIHVPSLLTCVFTGCLSSNIAGSVHLQNSLATLQLFSEDCCFTVDSRLCNSTPNSTWC
jgi:hypothetical protein